MLDRLRRVATRAALAAPGPVLAAIAGGSVRRDGRTLDPQLAAALAGAARLHIPGPHELGSVPEGRVHAARSLALFDTAPRPMAQVIDTAAPGPGGPIPIRIYRPRAAASSMLVYFHGGGGVIGSIASYDATVRLLADESRCVIASVEYRLAPEHPHPAAVDDALAAWAWLVAQAPARTIDPARIGVGGDSFGGYLSAMIGQRAPIKPRRSFLIYPLLDLTNSSPSYETFADGFMLTESLISWFRGNYTPDPAPRRAASPFFLDDVSRTPPTTIITAGFDPLRDEGEIWAQRLAIAGAEVTYRCHDSLIHGFVQMALIRGARAAIDQLCADLRDLL
ncbi:MAG: alpha/beta hydrolase [Deltaproteobacteria bacterium]|nr:alpha/beta hydrolase [Deltaproteobacteria bacterium]